MKTDEQNQLVTRAIRAKDVCDRKADELIGICRGIIADGEINQKEAEFIINWINLNCDLVSSYPFNIVYTRISEMLSDGYLSEDEKEDLFDLMTKLTGGEVIGEENESMSSTLPL